MADPFPEERITRPVESGDIPHFYANGFANSLTAADILVVLEQNGRAIATLNMSYNLAKTLVLKLGELVGSYETLSKVQVITTEEFNEAVQTEASKHA